MVFSNWKRYARAVGTLFGIFMLDFMANIAAGTIDIPRLWTTADDGHPRSEPPTERKDHASSDHKTPAVEIAVVVLVCAVLLFTMAACVGSWFRADILTSMRRTATGFHEVDTEDEVDADEDVELVSGAEI